MESKNFGNYFFIAALIAISIVTFFIFQPFFVAIIIAAILAVILQRPYNFFLRLTGNRKKLSALIISLLGIVVFGAFFLGVVSLAIKEFSSIYQSIAANSNNHGQAQFYQLIENINSNQTLRSFGIDNLINAETAGKSVSDFGQIIFSILQKTYQGVANFLLMSIVVFFTLYYFLANGKELVSKIMYLSPLKDSYEEKLIEKFVSISSATLKGSLIVSIIQGTIGGIAFAVAGVPSAVICGIAMMLFSLIPMIGTAIIWLPVGLIMLVLGHLWQGIFILAIGALVVSTIDNFLKPKLVGKNVQLNPLLVFFSMLGGIKMFGFLGFVIGPIIVSLFITLWDIYGIEFKRELKQYNS